MIQIIKRCRHLLLMMICLMCASPTLKAQSEMVLGREDDESVTSTVERQEVLAILLEAGRQALDSGQSAKAARFMNRAGRLQLELNLPNDSLATYKAALKLVKQATDSSARVDSLNGVATAYTHLSKCEQARRPLREALASSEQVGYVPGKAEALLIQAACQNYEDHSVALRSARESLGLWQSVNRKWGIARSYAAMGHYQLAQNDLIEATESQQAALNLWRELNNVPEQAEALINLGFIEYRKGAWQSSLTFLTEAQGLLDDKADPFTMGQIIAGIGEAFIESGMPETGLPKLQQSLAYFRLAQRPRSVIILNWDIGRTYYLLADYPQALATLQSALTDAEAIQETAVSALCHDFLGRTVLALNERTTALRHFQTALAQYLKVSDRMEAARTKALIGKVYEQDGEIGRARQEYQQALQSFRALSDHLNESATLYALGRLELQQKNLDLAEDYLRQSIEATEDIRRVSTSSDLAAAFSATVHERYESYIECLMRKATARLDQGLDVRAFETSELARARSLTELLRATQTNLVPGLDPQLAEQEKLLRQSLRVKEDYKVTLLARAYKKEELDALDHEIKGLESKYKQATETIRERYPAYDKISQPSGWSLSQIQEQVIADDQTVLLEYSLGNEKSYVWAVTREHIKSYELPAEEQINKTALGVYRLLAAAAGARNENELDQAAKELSQMILAPVAGELSKRRIIVVADGALNYVPFQLLPTPAGRNEPLVADYEVINTPSASILGQLRDETARRQTPAKVLAAFGDPVFASNYAQQKSASNGEHVVAMTPAEDSPWRHALRDIESDGDSLDASTIQPLFYSKLELANLRSAAGPETLMVTGFDATRQKLAGANLADYAILHFATHGILDPKRPENSGLFLSMVNRDGQPQNGFVGLQDIYGLHAPVSLVVLSACRTGLGKDVRGEGLIGLTRGFMYAGASSVIASLWKVDDEATAELMKRLYANMLQSGMTPAAALRAAQNSIRSESQWRSPHFWAAFTLQGEYRQVIQHRPAGSFPGRTRIAIGLSLLLLLLTGAWWYRRRSIKT